MAEGTHEEGQQLAPGTARRDVEEAAANARESRGLAGGGTAIPPTAQEIIEAEGSADAVSESRASSSRISLHVFGEGPEPRDGFLHELSELVKTDRTFTWVDLSDYRAPDLHEVAHILDLDRVAVHVALSGWQRPRLDSFTDHFFVATTVARVNGEQYRIRASQLDLFVGRNFLVSTHKFPLPFHASIIERARKNPQLIDLDSGYMLYIILDELLAHYEDLAEDVGAEIERAEEMALSDPSDAFLQDIVHLKRYAFALDQLAQQHRQVFEAFLRPDFSSTSGNEVNVYFRDLDNRMKRLLDTLRSMRDAVNGAFDIYVSHMAHRTNNIVRVLTIVSSVILPLTLVVSFFGTSFRDVPLYSHAGFVAMLVSMLAVAATVMVFLRWQRWI